MTTSCRLLVLDDDSAVGETIASIAESIGLVSRAEHLPDAFFGALDEWEPTHIAIDLAMPEMDGVQVIERLARRNCRAQIVITSGLGGRVLEAAQRSAREHGLTILGVLPKPFVVADLTRLFRPQPVPGVPGPGVGSTTGKREPAPLEATIGGLRHAIEHGQLFVVYQPKVVCATGEPAGFEALVRWSHPELGMMSPDAFVPLAERVGLIGPLTDVVLNDALGWLSGNAQRAANLTLSVNVSARSLSDATFADHVAARCEEHRIDPSRVILEVTETSAMDDPLTSLDCLTRLRLKGFQLSIDDFGTGYSSMLQLVRLPFSEIKIDRSFVGNATRSAESRAVVKSIVMLAASLGLASTAEGVEDLETLQLLSSVHCERAQGYFCARPMPGDVAAAWLDERASLKPAQ